MKIRLTVLMICLLNNLAAQNVGIGVTNALRAKFEVHGAMGRTVGLFGGDGVGISLQKDFPAIGFNQYFDGFFSRYIGNGYAAVNWFNPTLGTLNLDMFPNGSTNASASASRVMTITNTGNMSIGNAAANGNLQFSNALFNRKIVLYESANNNHQYYGFGIEGGTLRYAVDGTGAAHRFYAGTGTASSLFLMSIGGDKKVLIGQQEQGFKLGINTTNPLYTIEMVQAGNKGLGFINPLNGYHYWEMKSEAYNLSSDCLILYMDGATSPKGWFRPTDGGYSSNSDSRLKKDIVALDNILPKLLQLKPSSYHFIKDPTQQDCIGFIAQDVKKLFPELVDVIKTEDKNIADLHGINYSGLSVIAIKAVQEQQEQIALLQKEVAELKKIVQNFINK